MIKFMNSRSVIPGSTSNRVSVSFDPRNLYVERLLNLQTCFVDVAFLISNHFKKQRAGAHASSVLQNALLSELGVPTK